MTFASLYKFLIEYARQNLKSASEEKKTYPDYVSLHRYQMNLFP